MGETLVADHLMKEPGHAEYLMAGSDNEIEEAVTGDGRGEGQTAPSAQPAQEPQGDDAENPDEPSDDERNSSPPFCSRWYTAAGSLSAPKLL